VDLLAFKMKYDSNHYAKFKSALSRAGLDVKKFIDWEIQPVDGTKPSHYISVRFAAYSYMIDLTLSNTGKIEFSYNMLSNVVSDVQYVFGDNNHSFDWKQEYMKALSKDSVPLGVQRGLQKCFDVISALDF